MISTTYPQFASIDDRVMNVVPRLLPLVHLFAHARAVNINYVAIPYNIRARVIKINSKFRTYVQIVTLSEMVIVLKSL